MKKILIFALVFGMLLCSCTQIPTEKDFSYNNESSQNNDFLDYSEETSDYSFESNVSADIRLIYTAEPYEYEYNIPSRYYSEGIKNIVKRARQLAEFRWTPKKDVVGFNGDNIFKANEVVTGIPYGQPVQSGAFIGYGASLDTFKQAVSNINSKLYTDVARYEEDAPYYSTDCSTLVCYAWARPSRMIALILTQFGDYCGDTVNDIQVGDTLITVGDATHAVLVTGIKENSEGEVVWVEITEATPPITRVTRYGENELYSIDDLNKLYFENGYKAYRNTDYRDNTPYTHSCASPIDNDTCSKCENADGKTELIINNSDSATTLTCSILAKDIVSFAYTVEDINYGRLKYETKSTVPLVDKAGGSKTLYNIPEKTLLTVLETQTDTNGVLWGRTRSGGKGGFVKLDGCKLLGGSITRSDFVTFDAKYNGNTATATLTLDEYLYDGCIVHIYAIDKNGAKTEIGKVLVKSK